jgi:hypothetical protein
MRQSSEFCESPTDLFSMKNWTVSGGVVGWTLLHSQPTLWCIHSTNLGYMEKQTPVLPQ